ncbi:putative CRM domain-containing protein [Camellia lanceoleosa]|uniref:CRM domain-containing protein n=1 Tax=Camellia lanceoleosa TaxID=1840588 RepID=A0ACC0G1E5_9ERIC|nr:putative CRM domain-containing protein [Camellia lanceoleosa]
MREKQKRKAANKRDPRWLGVKGKKKKKFANAEERIKDKLEKTKRYEVPKLQCPAPKPHDLTGEERFYLKKMKHETVEAICKPCKPGQVHEYANEIARLSGGIPIHTIGDDTIIFYRGKNYVQPEVMLPIDTLSKKRALEKSKYEQSLESVKHFTAIAEKELELYYRHVALYGSPNSRSPNSILDSPKRGNEEPKRIEPTVEGNLDSTISGFSPALSEAEIDSTDHELSETEDDFLDEDPSVGEIDLDDDNVSRNDLDSCDEGEEP